jgi:hypothetical protein
MIKITIEIRIKILKSLKLFYTLYNHFKLTQAADIQKLLRDSENGQELKPKHVGAIINKKNCATS